MQIYGHKLTKRRIKNNSLDQAQSKEEENKNKETDRTKNSSVKDCHALANTVEDRLYPIYLFS